MKIKKKKESGRNGNLTPSQKKKSRTARDSGKVSKNPFVSSLKALITGRFWLVFLLDFLVIFVFCVVFLSFSSKVNNMIPELTQMLPFAKDAYNLVEKFETGKGPQDMSGLTKNISEVRSRTYSMVYRILAQLLISLLIFMILFSVISLVLWSILAKTRLTLSRFAKFFLLNIIWILLIFLMVFVIMSVFRKPANLGFAIVSFFMMTYFGTFAHLLFCRTGKIKTAIIRCFMTGIKKSSLRWLGISLAVLTGIIGVSILLVRIHFSFFLLGVVLMLVFFPWSKTYLYNEFSTLNIGET